MARAAAVAVAAIVALQPAVSAAPPADVARFLQQASFTAADTAALESGNVIARVMPGGAESEIMTVAAVKIRATREQTASYYGQMISYVDGKVTTAFGRFGNPPAPGDVAMLTLEPGELSQIKSCKPRDCDIRIGGTALTTLRSSIDWNAPDAAERANTRVRQAIVDYAAAYMKNGNAALVTYNDRAEPVSAGEQWRGILAN